MRHYDFKTSTTRKVVSATAAMTAMSSSILLMTTRRNNRYRRRRRLCIIILMVLLVMLVLAFILVSLLHDDIHWVSTHHVQLNNSSSHDYRTSSTSQQQQSTTKRKSWNATNILDNYEMSMESLAHDPIPFIKNGFLHLIDIHLSDEPYQQQQQQYDPNNTTTMDHSPGQHDTPPYSAKAIFCHLEWSMHKKDPSFVPMYKDLQKRSPGCRRSTVQVDLFSAVVAARQYDQQMMMMMQSTQRQAHTGETKMTMTTKTTTAIDTNDVVVKSMNPTGFIFHESRCGSTVVANSLVAWEPDQSRVYSESGPPILAARAFDQQFYNESIQLVRDVIYLMGRTNDDREEYLFFKIQSIGSKYIGVFREAFPETPWIFVYRDPIQVLRSHLKVKGTTHAVCLRSRHDRHPAREDIDAWISNAMMSHHESSLLVSSLSSSSSTGLSTEEFCAAHLATLCEAAEKEILNDASKGGMGMLVNYKDLPNILIQNVLPFHFLRQNMSLSKEAMSRIWKVNEKYSKRRSANRLWRDDSRQKEEGAWEEIIRASALLMPVYRRLEALRVLQKGKV